MSEERERPTHHPPRPGTICIQPDQHWHSLEVNHGETTERRDGALMGLPECMMPS